MTDGSNRTKSELELAAKAQKYLEASRRIQADNDAWKLKHSFWPRITNSIMGAAFFIVLVAWVGPPLLKHYALYPWVTLVSTSFVLLVVENTLYYLHSCEVVKQMRKIRKNLTTD